MAENKKKKLSFEEKFGFEGQEMPAGISKKDRKKILNLHRRSEYLIEAGRIAGERDETKY